MVNIYDTLVDVEGDDLTPALIRSMVYANAMIMEQCLPGILAVLYGDKTPLEAIHQSEG